jgi:putative heme-binding domain-containing protein
MIDQHADHYHFDTGKGWQASRDGAANDLGGGHAHSGAVIYQGDNWPPAYRDKLLTLNLHGRRINCERLERHGSGFQGRHAPDFAVFADPWFRGLDLATGPDGGVFVIDWSDTGECHESTGVHRTSGRIFKIVYGPAAAADPASHDIRHKSSLELAALLGHANAWFARQAADLLAGRHYQGEDLSAVKLELRRKISSSAESAHSVHRLRALWGLTRLQAPSERDLELQKLLHDPDEHVRVWGIRLLVDGWPLDTVLGRRPARKEAVVPAGLLDEFVRIAANDPSPLVRLTLASTLQRLPLPQRAPLAIALLRRAEDAQDHNLPLVVWYGLAPLGNSDPQALVPLAAASQWPGTRRLIARRLAENVAQNQAPLNALLTESMRQPAPFAADVMAGLSTGLAGWHTAPRPAAWDEFQRRFATDAVLGEQVRDLSVLFGDGRALDEVRRVALDEAAEIDVRGRALQTLVDTQAPELDKICEKLLNVRFVNVAALRGLAALGQAESGARLVRAYRTFHQSDRPQVISALVARPRWAMDLLDAIAAGRIPREDLTPFHARQIRSLGDDTLNERLRAVWGELRDSPDEKRAIIEELKTKLTPEQLAQADPSRGRAVFAKACATCHTLYGEGARRGPDLTGSQRTNLDYLLENIVDPSATVAADYRVHVFSLADGRVLTGVATARTANTISIMTQTETLTLQLSEVESQQPSAQSLMPDGLLQPLTADQTLDLFAYLGTRQQVPAK